MNTELDSLEFLAARWAIELVDLQLKTRPDRMPGNETLARWRHLCEMRADALQVIGRMRACNGSRLGE